MFHSSCGFLLKRLILWLILLVGSMIPNHRATAETVIVLDPGHGGHESGAVWGGVREKHLNLSIARRVEGILRSKGYTTVMTRRKDVFLSLAYRARVANQFRRAVLVSIHCNSDGRQRGRGIETYYAGPGGKRLARQIHRRLDARTSAPNRGLKPCRFSVLCRTDCPAALVECGFVSSKSERRLLCNSAYQQRVALAIAEGIAIGTR
ncbi:MAG: N-acetylmuramoyl-L-alanine amidase [Verrucomicrobiaceae bacterium]|nr:MAG: N-acetylmuramoyl-L-alanine amidase [Verrucomicrobiaceae bacterium]